MPLKYPFLRYLSPLNFNKIGNNRKKGRDLNKFRCANWYLDRTKEAK